MPNSPRERGDVMTGDLLRRYVIGHFDLCTGCRICELACSWTKFGTYAPTRSAIHIEVRSKGLMVQPIVCSQCENAYCIKACPFGAIEKNKELGIIRVIDDKCTGCGLCAKVCPIGAIKVDNKTKKAIKCDLCGGDPACVRHCPTKALELLNRKG